MFAPSVEVNKVGSPPLFLHWRTSVAVAVAAVGVKTVAVAVVAVVAVVVVAVGGAAAVAGPRPLTTAVAADANPGQRWEERRGEGGEDKAGESATA